MTREFEKPPRSDEELQAEIDAAQVVSLGPGPGPQLEPPESPHLPASTRQAMQELEKSTRELRSYTSVREPLGLSKRRQLPRRGRKAMEILGNVTLSDREYNLLTSGARELREIPWLSEDDRIVRFGVSLTKMQMKPVKGLSVAQLRAFLKLDPGEYFER